MVKLDEVASAANLGGFLHWAKDQPEEVLEWVMDRVHIVQHKFAYGEVQTPGVHGRSINVVSCQVVGCQRCTGGVGGYKFLYGSSKWTKKCWVPEPGESYEAFNRRFQAGGTEFIDVSAAAEKLSDADTRDTSEATGCGVHSLPVPMVADAEA